MSDDDHTDWPKAMYRGREEPVHPSIHRVVTRAGTAGLKCGWSRLREFDGTLVGPVRGYVYLPDGSGERELRVDEKNADAWEQSEFEQWHLIPGHEAIWDARQGTITSAVKLSWSSEIKKIPGLQMSQSGLVSDGFSLHLSPSDEHLSILLVRPQPTNLRIFGNGNLDAALVIDGVRAESHQKPARLLTELATSFFVDLSISFDVTFALKTHRDRSGEGRDDRPAINTHPRFPVNQYNLDAASLYLYARSFTASQSATLQYLAFYQVIEFFAPVHARGELVTRLRNAIKDPTFNPSDDTALGRVVAMLSGGRNALSDREQVIAAVRTCVEEDELSAWLDARPIAAKALADKQRMSGIRLIQLRDKNASLVAQAADRIYDLRCRIVHAKEDGGYVEPLRMFDPVGKELLLPDIDLVRFVAERVLITSSRPAAWT